MTIHTANHADLGPARPHPQPVPTRRSAELQPDQPGLHG